MEKKIKNNISSTEEEEKLPDDRVIEQQNTYTSEMFHDKFYMFKHLGKGQYGEVLQAKLKHDQYGLKKNDFVAIKVIVKYENIVNCEKELTIELIKSKKLRGLPKVYYHG